MVALQYRPSVASVNGECIEMRVRTQVFSLPRVRNWGKCLDRTRIIEAGKRREDKYQTVAYHLSHEGWSWQTAPINLLLDMHFNTDLPINYGGNWFAVDLTIKSDELSLLRKQRELNRLGYLGYSPVALDASAVWVIDPNNMPTNEKLVATLKAMRVQKAFSEIYYL